MEKLKRRIYIFVSHSHKDIEKVRVIRNYLEGLGGEPILFFLLSLTDEDEITTLIKNEIASRIWFIYCESPNAKASKWVRTELDYTKEIGKKNFLNIDLNEAVNDDLELNEKYKQILFNFYNKIKLLSQLFIIYPNRLRNDVHKMIKIFQSLNINLFAMPESFSGFTEDSFYQHVENTIKNAACILNVCDSRDNYPIEAIELAERYQKRIVFLHIKGRSNTDFDVFQPDISKYFYYQIDINNFKEDCENLIEMLFEKM